MFILVSHFDQTDTNQMPHPNAKTTYHVHGSLTHCGHPATFTITTTAESDDEAQAFAFDLLGECMNVDVAEIEVAD